MKLLFIDHEFHLKTKSAEFFVSILKKAFDVTEHYYSCYYRTGAHHAMQDHDAAVIWEFPISRNRFYIPGKRNIFVPMYDNEWGSYWQWKRIAWSGMGVISFCDKVTRHARRCGVKNILDVRYFPEADKLPQELGDPRRVFLWERGDVTRAFAETLFPPAEGYVFETKGKDDFWPREDYLKRLSACGVVIAPRKKEGIGMAYLEAMAMGKCVVAHNDATMDEYIEDGRTGLLFDSGAADPIAPAAVARVCENLSVAIKSHSARWRADAQKINAFIASQAPCRPSLFNRFRIAVTYPLYLVEGLLWRLRHV